LFHHLNTVTKRESYSSVHLANFPTVIPDDINEGLEKRMQIAQDACSLLLSLRKKANIKVRQPLQKAIVPLVDPSLQFDIDSVADIIKSEVNIKEIEYISGDNDIIKKKIKANFKTLGAKMGPLMKAVAAEIGKFGAFEIVEIEKNGVIHIHLEGQTVEITSADVEITSDDIPGLLVASKGILTVALDISITKELEEEGLAREFVNRIQKIRKDSDFALTDRINVTIEMNELLKSALDNYNYYICKEILANNLKFSTEIVDGTEIEVNNQQLKVLINKN
jgi:isoleucyl-tRNA synthetase